MSCILRFLIIFKLLTTHELTLKYFIVLISEIKNIVVKNIVSSIDIFFINLNNKYLFLTIKLFNIYLNNFYLFQFIQFNLRINHIYFIVVKTIRAFLKEINH